MKTIIGATRMTLAVSVILIGLLPTLVLRLVSWRYRGARLGGWCMTLMARALMRVLNVRFTCTDASAYASHHGLIFSNHSSYLDILALLHVAPVRFLGAREVKRIPAIGAIAASAETVFVERRDKDSRRAARSAISEVLKSNPYPPIILFPEGRLGPGDRLMPFRYGAFELAIENESPYLLCAIRYDRPDVMTWYGGTRNEGLFTALWRLATFDRAVSAELVPLTITRPSAADDAALLATVAQRAVERELGMPPGPALVDEAPPAQWQLS